jgi:hypothetical protein
MRAKPSNTDGLAWRFAALQIALRCTWANTLASATVEAPTKEKPNATHTTTAHPSAKAKPPD